MSKILKRKSISHYIQVSYSGNQSISPIDIVKSEEGHNSFLKDRAAIPSKIPKKNS